MEQWDHEFSPNSALTLVSAAGLLLFNSKGRVLVLSDPGHRDCSWGPQGQFLEAMSGQGGGGFVPSVDLLTRNSATTLMARGCPAGPAHFMIQHTPFLSSQIELDLGWTVVTC